MIPPRSLNKNKYIFQNQILKKFGVSKFRSTSRKYYYDRFASNKALESILSRCFFS